MEINGNRLILLALVGAFTVTASLYFITKNNTNDNKSVSSLVASVEANKTNITIIKKNIDKLLASSKATNLDNAKLPNEQLNTTNNDIQSLMQRYEALSSELQAIKQKNLQPTSQNQALQTEAENPVVNLEDMQAARKEEKRKYEERMRQYEEDWQAESVDTIATTEIQSELENIFPSDIEGLNGASSECKSSGCKITLDLTDDFSGSPVPMLLDNGGSFFHDKNFTVENNIDPSTGQMRTTIYVTKDINNEEG